MDTLRIHKDERIALLRGIGLFSGCSDEELRQIRSLQSELETEQSAILAEQGRMGNEFFVIVNGTATVIRNGVPLAHLGPGDFFGELALLDRGPRTATVRADMDMRLLVFSHSEFSNLRQYFPGVASKMLAELGARLRRANTVFDGTAAVGDVEVQAS
jgi:CRP-like cAMP-binding protein